MAYFKSLDHVIAALALAGKSPQRASAFFKKALATPDLGRAVAALESYQQVEFAKLERLAKAKGISTASLLSRKARAEKLVASKGKARKRSRAGAAMEDFDSVLDDLTVESDLDFDEDLNDQELSSHDGLTLDDIEEDLEGLGTDSLDMDMDTNMGPSLDMDTDMDLELGETLEDVAFDEGLEDGLDLNEGLEFSGADDNEFDGDEEFEEAELDLEDDEEFEEAELDLDDEDGEFASDADEDEDDLEFASADEDEDEDEDEEDDVAEARVKRISRANANQRALARMAGRSTRKIPGRR